MNLWINIALLSLGFIGASLAFGGETWVKIDAPIHKRITSRGWLSITCLLLALALGIWKEVRTEKAAAADAKEREQLKQDLKDARTALVSVEPTVLDAMYKLTARIVRELDFAFVELQGGMTYTPTSSETHSPLRLYGGDEVEYDFYCRGRNQGPGRSIKIAVGSREYTLDGDHGVVRVAGPIGEPMVTRVINSDRVTDCDLKLIIKSTDRTRVETQFAPILEAINKAKEAQRNNELR
jgi:hypothetical protein